MIVLLLLRGYLISVLTSWCFVVSFLKVRLLYIKYSKLFSHEKKLLSITLLFHLTYCKSFKEQ